MVIDKLNWLVHGPLYLEDDSETARIADRLTGNQVIKITHAAKRMIALAEARLIGRLKGLGRDKAWQYVGARSADIKEGDSDKRTGVA